MKNYQTRYIFLLLIVLSACTGNITPDEVRNEKPSLFPDYDGVTIPSTIAPLNFKALDDYSAIAATIEASGQKSIQVQGKEFIQIPTSDWSDMLNSKTGDSIRVTVSLKQNGKWIQYAPFPVYISEYPIDYSLVYRLIAPGYEVYSKMGIYQRELSTYNQSPIVENTLIPGSCVNCHSFRQNNPQDMSLHIRGKKGGTILKTKGEINLLTTKTDSTMSNFVYPYWHPTGNYLAYSVNKTHQVFHSVKDERVEVVDFASDVIVYDVKNNRALGCDQLMKKNIFETFPSFSADGKSLFFCAADEKEMPANYKEIKYNLCRIAFNPEDGTFGDRIDTLFFASAKGKSVTFPRCSPDGKYIMFTLIDYGNFSIWHKEADLFLLDLQTGQCRPIDEVNSPDTESYHSWSSNSHWFVFSSRRIDGLYTRPFMASIGEDGSIGKPFLLPQKNPDFYMNLMQSFNIPEFVTGEVELDPATVEKLVQKDENTQVGYRKL